MAVNQTRRKLTNWMQEPGNWRFKALFAAHLGDVRSEDLGKAWPTNESERERILSGQTPSPRNAPASREYRPLETARGYEDHKNRFNEPHRARELSANDTVFDEDEVKRGLDEDTYISRMLMNESITEIDVLFREELLDTVIRGARIKQVARDLANVVDVDTRKGDHPRASARIFAPQTAEGAQIEFDEENYDTVSWDAEKFALGFQVTDELIDQGLVDVIERNVAFTGAAVENAINRKYLNTVVDNFNNTFDHGIAGADGEIDTGDIAQAFSTVEFDDFPAPDTAVIHPEYKASLLDASDNNFLFANRAGDHANEVHNEYEVPTPLMGMDAIGTASDSTYDSGSETWGFAADGETGAVAYAREFVNIYMYRDMETKDFEDPIRDIQGGNVRAQFDVSVTQGDAGVLMQN